MGYDFEHSVKVPIPTESRSLQLYLDLVEQLLMYKTEECKVSLHRKCVVPEAGHEIDSRGVEFAKGNAILQPNGSIAVQISTIFGKVAKPQDFRFTINTDGQIRGDALPKGIQNALNVVAFEIITSGTVDKKESKASSTIYERMFRLRKRGFKLLTGGVLKDTPGSKTL